LQNHISLHQRTIPIYIKKLKSKMSNSSQKLKIFVFSLTSHINHANGVKKNNLNVFIF
jgi:hypothetical protein